MTLRKLLEDPAGGQAFSAIMLLVALVAMEALPAFHLYKSISAGTQIRFIDPVQMLILGKGIWLVVQNLRMRHVSR